MIKKLMIFIFILCFVFFDVKAYFHTGFPYTHDGENHLARFANYKIAVKEGQIPPRFAPNLMNHYGYPVFNYNYPLANILSVPFAFFRINYELTFKIIAICFVLLGLMGTYGWVFRLTRSNQASLWSVAIFSATPFLINTINYRGNIGEIMALGIIPCLLWLIEKHLVSRVEIGSWNWLLGVALVTAFALCHNVTFVFGLPLIMLYAVFRFKGIKSYWIKFFSILCGGALLSAWFWLPAIFEQTEIVVGSASLSKTFADHFPTLAELLFSPSQFGFSQPGVIDSLSFNLGSIQVIILVLATMSIIKKNLINRSFHDINWWWLGLIIGSWVLLNMQLSWSSFIWSSLPFLRYIQFPWRLSLFFSIAIAGVSGYFWQISSKQLRLIMAGILLIQMVALSKVKPIDYFHRSIETYDAFGQSTSTANENLPKTWGYLYIGDWQPGPSVLVGNGVINVEYWKGSDRRYSLLVNETSIIVEPTMKFLGWETVVEKDGQKNRLSYLESENIRGRIAYQLSPGHYQVRTRFTQNTFSRLAGNTIFLISSMLLLLIVIYKNRLIKNA